jgi:hypothetical protein
MEQGLCQRPVADLGTHHFVTYGAFTARERQADRQTVAARGN